MDLKYIHYLQTIARLGNISAAARELFISQPSLSQCLKKYEDELGHQIFARTKQGLKLTPEGEIFLNTATQMQNLERSMKNHLQDLDHTVSGEVIFGVSSHRAPFVLPLILPQLQLCYPRIAVKIVEGRTKDLEYSLLRGDIDVGFLIPPLRIDSIPFEVFTKEEIFLAVPKSFDTGHLAHAREDGASWISLSDLKDFPFLLYDVNNRLHDFTNDLFLRESFQPKETMTFRSLSAISRLASAGMGITVLPEMFIEPQFQLDYYSIGPEGCYRTQALGYPPGIYRTKATELFSQLVVETLLKEQTAFRKALFSST